MNPDPDDDGTAEYRRAMSVWFEPLVALDSESARREKFEEMMGHSLTDDQWEEVTRAFWYYTTNEKDRWTIGEVEAHTGLSRNELLRLRKRNLLPAPRSQMNINGGFRWFVYDRAEIEAWWATYQTEVAR